MHVSDVSSIYSIALPSQLKWQRKYPCHDVRKGGGGGGNSLRPYSQQRPMRTNLSSCLGLIHNGQNHSTNRLLIFVPHEGTHGTMCLIKQLRMVRPKTTKMRAIKEAMPLIPNGLCGAEGASAQLPWHSWPIKPALLNWQSM